MLMIHRDHFAGSMPAGDEWSSPHSLMEEMMRKIANLTHSTCTAQYFAGRAIKQAFILRGITPPDEIRWSWCDISESRPTDSPNHPEKVVSLKGIVYENHRESEPPAAGYLEVNISIHFEKSPGHAGLRMSHVGIIHGSHPDEVYFNVVTEAVR